MIREAYQQATALFVDTVGQISPAQWALPGLGDWNVRDLVGHTARALLTVETYLDRPPARAEMAQPADYFLRARNTRADPAAVAARGREAGEALGPTPAAAVQDIARRVLARVDETPDDALVGTPVGGMRLIDYLPTRVFELTIHTLDLGRALDRDVRPGHLAAAVTFDLVGVLAFHSDLAPRLLLAATGRLPLPAGFTVL